ncbi:alpha/beta hydrolase [Paraburkholderia sp. LEh10]|uniref:alpha/beta fold hydrolase n=1 Tax=Paraburkholderia sp. LEh10 TaxID=2821353 RepID=UPI001AE29A51|nr:alpha/beta hydrolase [Paraburkholderia sp. LEh10]MBP0588267.1 alpha/beta hydrolase [Paraburkholderia sp. LEh10]
MARSFQFAARPGGTTRMLIAAAVTAASSAMWVQHRSKKAERDNPPFGQFIEVDGVRLHYVDQGQGAAVVLLHGNTVQLQDFYASGLIERLAVNHRVIAFDRPGFGYSERPRKRLWTPQAQAALIQRALWKMRIARPVVLGHSWGALVALGMAIRDPADVRGLVLISGYYFPTARMDVALTAPAAIPVLGDVLRYTTSPLAGRILLGRTANAMFSPMPTPNEFFDLMPREMLLRPRQMRAEAEDGVLMIPAVADFRRRYSTLDVPVCIIAGERDKIVRPAAHSVRLSRELPYAALLVVPGAGHMVHYSFPRAIDDAIHVMTRDRSTLACPSVGEAMGIERDG